MRTPLVHLRMNDSPSPSFHHSGYILSSPADVDAKDMGEKVAWLRPLVALELPCLARGEYCDNTLPVIWLELVSRVDEYEAHRPGWINVR